jgi:hypothetical protein
LEGSINSEIYFESFTDEDLVQVFRIKPYDVAFAKGIALGELVFEILGVTLKSEGLTMSLDAVGQQRLVPSMRREWR